MTLPQKQKLKGLLQIRKDRIKPTQRYIEAERLINEIAQDKANSLSHGLIEQATRDARTIFELTKENAMYQQHFNGKAA